MEIRLQGKFSGCEDPLFSPRRILGGFGDYVEDILIRLVKDLKLHGIINASYNSNRENYS